MLPFVIRIEDGEPVSDQVVRSVRKAVLTGQLTEGDLFPSVRSMSQELKISPTTAHKVVSLLREEGLLISRPGIGMIVTSAKHLTRDERMKQLEPLCSDLLKEAGAMNLRIEDVIEALQRAAEGHQEFRTPRKGEE
ncbi:GntR family transcriptional regulator [Verrucomicrobia bacterium]|nr:GntR family transcriptional regulator [Verrucomicrobiota bacterium]